MRGIMFTAWMTIIGLCGLIVGGMTLWENFSWHRDSQAAIVSLVDQSRMPHGLVAGGPPTFAVDVKYTSASGEVVAPGVYMDRGIVERLWKGDAIHVHYSKSHQRYFRYDWDEEKSPWGWLTIGIAGSATALFARKLVLRQTASAAATAYPGSKPMQALSAWNSPTESRPK